MDTRRKVPSLLDLDWESVLKQLHTFDPKDPCYYILTINKGKEDEYRTKFMLYAEMLDLVRLAMEKQKRRIPISL